LGDEFKLSGTYTSKWRDERHLHWSVNVTWAEIFATVAPYVARVPNDSFVNAVLTKAMFSKAEKDGYDAELDDQLFRTVALQLKALNPVEINYQQTTSGAMALSWSLTPAGERLMMELRTVKKEKAK